MTKFLEAHNGALINADTISYIGVDIDEERWAHFKDKDAKPVKLADGRSSPEMALAPMFPASPGYMHLRVFGGAKGIHRTPIVGWRVHDGVAHPIPIVHDDIGAYKIETATLLPDGRVHARVIGSFGQRDVFADETAWLRAVEDCWRKETGERVLKAV